MRRPRILVLLAVVSVLLGMVSVTASTSTLIALTGSHDAFTKGVLESDPKVYGPMLEDKNKQAEKQNRADLDKISPHRADALWSRRNTLLPNAGLGLIAGVLLTLGALRMGWGTPTRRAWGRSAWQLGAIVGLLYETLDAMAARAQARELAAKITELTSPFAVQIRAMSETALPMAPQAISVLLLASAAIYLNGADSRAWSTQKA